MPAPAGGVRKQAEHLVVDESGTFSTLGRPEASCGGHGELSSCWGRALRCAGAAWAFRWSKEAHAALCFKQGEGRFPPAGAPTAGSRSRAAAGARLPVGGAASSAFGTARAELRRPRRASTLLRRRSGVRGRGLSPWSHQAGRWSAVVLQAGAVSGQLARRGVRELWGAPPRAAAAPRTPPRAA